MELTTMENLFGLSLKDMYSAENQLLKTLPLMMEASNNPELKEEFETHLQETREQISRLEEIAKHHEISLGGHACKGIKGLIEEGSEILDMEGEPTVIDLAIISVAQKIEHYEISGYASLISLVE